MRSAFFRELLELAAADERIQLVVGDLGFGAIEPFVRRFPGRFLNAGVAEQSMTGVAAGLALCGKVVFTYSIGNFPTLRCLEQIRNDVCYHHANVKIVSVGGGLAYGSLGMTHHATEDLAIMRALPGMIVVAPGDPWEVEQATRAIAGEPGPCYLRLGRAGEPRLHGPGAAFKLGRGIRMREGRDLTIMSTGGLLESALDVAEQLGTIGIEARVVSMHTLKPLDEAEVVAAATETGAIATLEEHSLIGGLGSAVAETLAESAAPTVRLKRFALPSAFVTEAGSQEYLRERYGLSPKYIVEALQGWL
jgi:transketolase